MCWKHVELYISRYNFRRKISGKTKPQLVSWKLFLFIYFNQYYLPVPQCTASLGNRFQEKHGILKNWCTTSKNITFNLRLLKYTLVVSVYYLFLILIFYNLTTFFFILRTWWTAVPGLLSPTSAAARLWRSAGTPATPPQTSWRR